MDNKELEIIEHPGAGYFPVVKFGAWRVATASLCQRWKEGNTKFMERHMLTDEVFVLIKGKGSLFIGEKRTRVEMEIGKVYNVKKAVWHEMVLDEEALVLIVENDDTGKENTEYCDF